MRILTLLFCLLIILGHTASILAQDKIYTSVYGSVADDSTGEALFGASVYFVQTTIGVMTDAMGNFTIRTENPGNYELAVSMVGYKSQRKHVFLEKGKSYKLDVRLKPAPINLNTVDVIGEGADEWKKDLEIFKTKFLGSLAKPDDCILENTEFINFKWDGKTLIASSSKPVIIINKYLGYKISAEIKEFKFNPETTEMEYSVIPQYFEIEPKDKDQKEEWENNRKAIYYGSPEHFLLAFRYDRLKENNFKVFLVSTPSSQNTPVIKEVLKRDELLSEDQFSEVPMYKFTDYLQVVYITSSYGVRTRYKMSFAKLRYPYFSIDDNGIANVHLPFQVFGYWSQFGVASLLPRNYVPAELNRQNPLMQKN